MILHRRHPPSAFTVVELLISCAMLGLLAALLLPAISRSRESARRLDCTQRLHQVGLSLVSHHETLGHLPAGWMLDPLRESAYGWFSHLLPFTESEALHAQISESRPLSDVEQAAAIRTSLPLAICPSDVQDPLFALYLEVGEHKLGGQQSDTVLLWLASANFVGVFGNRDPDDVPGATGNGPFIEGRLLRFAEFERGLSNTLFIGERTASKMPSTWVGFAVAGEDAASRVVGFADLGPNRDEADESEFASRHPGCANFLWTDGHVAAIADSIDCVSYRSLTTRTQEQDP